MRFDTPQQRLQADLVWAISSVDMMQLEEVSEAQGLRSVAASPVANALNRWLHNNDHSTALHQLVATRQPHRLGVYYEVLWQYIFEHFPGFKLISRNLPVQTNKRTLGEMDFVYYCALRQRHIHLETAVKFYLGLPSKNTNNSADEQTPAQQQWASWIGPGCKDRLDLKLGKMLNQQIRLSNSPEGSATLQQLGVSNVLQEICLKGYFFYPLAHSCNRPPHSHEQHARGYWLKQQALPELLPSDHWYILNKEEWLSPVRLAASQKLLDKAQLEEAIRQCLQAYNFPVMISRMQTARGFKEACRYFITPDDWPYSDAALS